MKTFADLNLKPEISRAIAELGFETPSPIQAQALPILLEKQTDFLGLAATGTGKTAAYGIPLLSSLDCRKNATQALILSPTRELAKQIAEHLEKIGRYLSPRIVQIYGGTGYNDQIQGLKRGAHIVVATPGRLIDHIEKGTMNLSQVGTIILDEADEMISMGFKEDLEKILKAAQEDGQENCHTWLFSATMHPDLRRIAERYLTDPESVQVNRTEMLSGTVKQIYYTLHEDEKPEAVCRILDAADQFYGLIFCQTKALVNDLTEYLRERGYPVDQLHGDRSQAERELTFKRFRKGVVKILVCTDVAARGLDVKDLTHVVNYSLPRELDSYVHRIGRTGRSGQAGIAISLVRPSHVNIVRRIEKLTRSPMQRGKIPSSQDVIQGKLANLLSRLKEVGKETGEMDRIMPFLEGEWQSFFADQSKTEITARFIALAYGNVFGQDQREIGAHAPEPSEHPRREQRRPEQRRPEQHRRRPHPKQKEDPRGRRRKFSKRY